MKRWRWWTKERPAILKLPDDAALTVKIRRVKMPFDSAGMVIRFTRDGDSWLVMSTKIRSDEPAHIELSLRTLAWAKEAYSVKGQS